VLVLAVGLPALTACSDASPPGEVEQSGTLTAALLTAGSDGATYQFPAGATMRLTNGSGYNATFPLDGSENVLTLQVPAGLVNVQLEFQSGTPRLRRTSGGVTTVVDAMWVDPQPLTIQITSGASTDLVLHFTVGGLGDLTFDMGSLAVALDVQRNATTQPAQVHETGQYIFSFQTFNGLSAEAQAYFAQTSGDSHTHFLDFNFLNAWRQTTASEVCADSRLDVFTTQDGESGFSRATNLLLGQNGRICITDFGTNDMVNIFAELLGPAPPALASMLPSPSYRFFVAFEGFVGDIYNGQTLQQTRLETPLVFNAGRIAHQIWDFVPNQEVFYQDGFVSGNLRLIP
jgi:hypothetical protein